MSIQSLLFNTMIITADQYKAYFNEPPKDIKVIKNIPYSSERTINHTLNIYYPKEVRTTYPVIVNVHGGGYVYSTKETYDTYCRALAQHGFAVVSYDYDLAPKVKYPMPLIQLNECLHWIVANNKEYQLNLDALFMIGDSAGAQIMAQYVSMLYNPKYKALFKISTPQINILGIAINCGFFNAIDRAVVRKKSFTRFMVRGLMQDYIGKSFVNKMNEINFEPYINKNFPPTFVANSVNDMLVGKAPDLLLHLRKNDIKVIYREYGQKDFFAQHNFQMDIRRPYAQSCTEDEMLFFKNLILHKK